MRSVGVEGLGLGMPSCSEAPDPEQPGPEPEPEDGVGGGARLLLDVLAEEGNTIGDDPIVVLRAATLVVSAEGGRGRWASDEGERKVARQRKHSPVP